MATAAATLSRLQAHVPGEHRLNEPLALRTSIRVGGSADLFVQPADAGHLADVVRGVLDRADRPIAWFHLPVPVERDDPAYFAPLAEVSVPHETELYLGLIHHEDGVEGAERRAAAAATAQARFGVATECGFGRGPSERTPALLDLHAAVAEAW